MRDYFTEYQSHQLDELCKSMISHIYALWYLKTDLLTGSSNEWPLFRNPHTTLHYGESVRRTGSLLRSSTGHWESSHRHFTTSNWRQTSRRHISRNSEMLKLGIVQQHTEVRRRFAALVSNDIDFLKKVLPHTSPDRVTFGVIGNTKCYRLYHENNYDDSILRHKSLDTTKLFELVLKSELRDPSSLIVELIQGVVIEGNRECLFGKIKLYACAQYGSQRIPRFDFVHVCIENNESQLILCIKVCRSNILIV
jgi:hypothetical protein